MVVFLKPAGQHRSASLTRVLEFGHDMLEELNGTHLILFTSVLSHPGTCD
jgi:hypothetical protein